MGQEGEALFLEIVFYCGFSFRRLFSGLVEEVMVGDDSKRRKDEKTPGHNSFITIVYHLGLIARGGCLQKPAAWATCTCTCMYCPSCGNNVLFPKVT